MKVFVSLEQGGLVSELRSNPAFKMPRVSKPSHAHQASLPVMCLMWLAALGPLG